MKNNRKLIGRKLCVFIAGVAVIFMVGTGLAIAHSINVANPLLTEAEITGISVPYQQTLGSSVSLPSTVTVSYSGRTHVAINGEITDPSGKTVSLGDELSFDQTGEYIVKYFFNTNGIARMVQRQIVVVKGYFTENGNEVIKASAADPLACGQDGIIVNLTDGPEFLYNKPVDLRKSGADGLTNIIELDSVLGTFDESGKYVPDAGAVWVRLTDCYNPNVYIELRMGKSVDYDGAFFPAVRSFNQDPTGLDTGTKLLLMDQRYVVLDDVQYRLWHNESGYANEGFPNARVALEGGFTWKYDYETMRVYVCWTTAGGEEEKHLITDLDELLIYDKGNVFPGWTTGEVYVSLYAEDYRSDTARNEIISIGEDKTSLLYGKEYKDSVAPEVTVLSEKTTETGIYGAVGDTVTIPRAEAIDINLTGTLDVAVYTGFGTNAVQNVSVSDGKFVLDKKDLYTIVYSARDSEGNVGSAKFTVLAKETADQRAIGLTSAQLDQVTGGENVAFGAGEAIDLSYTIGHSLNVGAKDVKVTVYIQSEKQSLTLTDEYTFVPRYSGDYAITYEYTDGFFTYEKSFTAKCSYTGVTSFCDEVRLPKQFIKNFTYSLEGVNAYQYKMFATEPTEVTPTAYVKFDGGEEIPIEDLNAFTVTGSKTAQIVFKANGAVLESDIVPIVDATYAEDQFDMAKMFEGDFTNEVAMAFGERARDITFISNRKSGDNTFSFVNPVSTRDFTFSYKTVEGYTDFGGLKLTLTDSEDPSKTYSLALYNNGENTMVSFNGSAKESVSDFIFFGIAAKNISYTHATHKLMIGGATFFEEIDIPSGKAYLDVTLTDIDGDAAIILSKINNQNVSGTIYKDNANPQIYVDDMQGKYAVGDVVALNVPEFSDVFSGINYAAATMRILADDGKPVKDASGEVITEFVWNKQYSILMDRVTRFYVMYTVEDFVGRAAEASFLVECVDTTAPTVVVDGIDENDVLHIPVGTEVNFTFTVSDDYCKTENITTYLHLYCDDMYQFVANICQYDPNSAPADGKYEAKFTISIKGTYTARIFAYDEEFNYQPRDVKIVVE